MTQPKPQLRLHNTATRRVEDFNPIDPGNVRMYVCGPTVYDRAHLGNARPVLVFDVLYRLLRHLYGPDHVTYVRNFTDVDDKIIARSAESGRPIDQITNETIRWYHEDMDALGALRPTHEPRATAYIPQMVAMTRDLIAKGHAYAAEGHVLFAVDSYAAYGKLSGRTVDDMIAGARVEVAPYKRNPMDFVLWKPAREGEPGWDSPWGHGRPGWHIECSAMAHELLGGAFDIHGGGNDLMFPHHENEIAQSCCAHPGSGFAKVWLHNEMLQVEGKKMSKSLGNFFTVRDLLDKGYPGEVIRFVMLSTHYRKPMDWTEKKAEEADQTLKYWSTLVAGLSPFGIPDDSLISALADDLNTPLAISKLHQFATQGNYSALRAGMDMFAFLRVSNDLESEHRTTRQISDVLVKSLVPAFANLNLERAEKIRHELDKLRTGGGQFRSVIDASRLLPRISIQFEDLLKGQKRIKKTFEAPIVDWNSNFSEITAKIKQLGERLEEVERDFPDEFELLDPETPVSEIKPSNFQRAKNLKVARLIAERQRARRDKDFARADQIREELASSNILLVDKPEGSYWTVSS